jgi:trigger factor
LNIQIENTENHSARLTVEVDTERFAKSMEKAARRIGNKVNIPGFRKGKAPFAVVVKYVGQQAVLEEALEELGNEIYREALAESKVEPYAPGSLEDVKTEPNLQLTFNVPKQPEARLSAYRELRKPFESAPVEDKLVDDTIRRMQEQRAVVETVSRGAVMEDVVKVHLRGDVTHPEHEHAHAHDDAHDHEGEDGGAHDHEHDHDHAAHTEQFIDEETELVLTAEKGREFLPGFAAHLVGMASGDKKTVALDYPDDFDLPQVAGHKYSVDVEVKEVKSRTLPMMNDDFVKQMTDGEVDNLLDFRIRVRKDLQDMTNRDADRDFFLDAQKAVDYGLVDAVLQPATPVLAGS